MKTSDGGVNWLIKDIGISEGLAGLYFADSMHGWIGGDNMTLLLTTDGGNTWIKSDLYGSSRITSIYFTNSQLGWAVGGWGTGIICKTLDGGKSWHQEKRTEYLSSVFFMDDMTGWIVGQNGTILKTTSAGEATYIQQKINFKPQVHGIQIEQNYPNPFNNQTKIRFKVSKTIKINIDIYDINGQKIKEIVNSTISPGIHHLEWDGKNKLGGSVSSGVYFVRISTPEFHKSIKMILIQ